ncbi:TPA: RNA methyltransferase [Candidatus Poribacteria bacterium]|nr:RNA methyltransferase [Candidatus Poribacteria bacterium]
MEVINIIEITSLRNPKIKSVKALRHAKYRERQGKFLVEGIRLVKEAIDCNAPIKMLLFCPNKLKSQIGLGLVDIAAEKGIECVSVPARVFDSISEKDNPQGIIAVVERLNLTFNHLESNNPTLLIVAYELRDPGNLGAIIRTADSAGASGVVITGISVDIFDPKTVRATMGSIFSLPVIRVKEIGQLKDWLSQNSIKMIATSPRAKRYYFDLAYDEPVAIILGNEAEGLDAEILEYADEVVKIPLLGRADSLNVASAAAIIIYEVVRQRMFHK